jgi:hypothetical protein
MSIIAPYVGEWRRTGNALWLEAVNVVAALSASDSGEGPWAARVVGAVEDLERITNVWPELADQFETLVQLGASNTGPPLTQDEALDLAIDYIARHADPD